VDPIIIVLLAIFIGIPILSVIVMGVFAVSADFQFVEVRVRGGKLRGAIASALARVLVKDTQNIQFPLEVVLEKKGLMGGATPLFGGATVRDIECQIFMDGEHVSTVTEARSTHIDSFQRVVALPVNVDLHLPKGVIRAYRDYRAKKRTAAEVELNVKGHVVVRHWWISRQVPVRVTRHVVVGDPMPRLVGVRWRPTAGDADVWDKAEARVMLSNPYRDEDLEGRLRFELRRRRRVLPDVLLAVHEEMKVQIKPGRQVMYYFDTQFVPADEAKVSLQQGADTAVSKTQAGQSPVLSSPAVESGPVVPDEEEDGWAAAVSLRVFWEDNELPPEEVRVLGVPGAKHGPMLALDANGSKKSRREARRAMVARLAPSKDPPL
jgi:hypothetical protein